jgi:2-polyprenyl-6-methoxyphenol hydroxylase-like FAD-dependent oxidoreductase
MVSKTMNPGSNPGSPAEVVALSGNSPSSSGRPPKVLVVGAGPTGLLLAGELERRDVPCLLIDALDAPREWDRATVVHSRSMEIFEALGLADRFLERGVKTRAARFHSGGEVLGKLDLELADTRYGFDLGISEEVTESVLTENLERYGGAVTRSTRLLEISPAADAVTAVLERDGERQELRVEWVVGCDGLHSAVRDQAGIEFPGTASAAQWAVFDATIDGWDEEFDVAAAYLEAPAVILTPLPDRRWRVYLRPTSDDSDLVSDATAVIHAYKPDVTFTGVENPVRFECHSRVAASFRSDRILLAGDAAHVCSPSEGHGMNTGLQDAFNLGWKLALVCRGVCGPTLLDSYETERRPVAMRVVESGSEAEGGQAMTADDERAARDPEIRRTFADPDSAHHEAVAAAELDRSYADSQVVAGDASEGLAAGRRLPDTASIDPPAREPCALHELTHRRGHTLLVIGGPGAAHGEAREVAERLESEYAGSPLVGAVFGLCMKGDGQEVGRLDGAVADQLGIEGLTVLAVRPDRYVGLRHNRGDPEAVRDYLEALTA